MTREQLIGLNKVKAIQIYNHKRSTNEIKAICDGLAMHYSATTVDPTKDTAKKNDGNLYLYNKGYYLNGDKIGILSLYHNSTEDVYSLPYTVRFKRVLCDVDGDGSSDWGMNHVYLNKDDITDRNQSYQGLWDGGSLNKYGADSCWLIRRDNYDGHVMVGDGKSKYETIIRGSGIQLKAANTYVAGNFTVTGGDTQLGVTHTSALYATSVKADSMYAEELYPKKILNARYIECDSLVVNGKTLGTGTASDMVIHKEYYFGAIINHPSTKHTGDNPSIWEKGEQSSVVSYPVFVSKDQFVTMAAKNFAPKSDLNSEGQVHIDGYELVGISYNITNKKVSSKHAGQNSSHCYPFKLTGSGIQIATRNSDKASVQIHLKYHFVKGAASTGLTWT